MGTFQFRAGKPTMAMLSVIKIESNAWTGTGRLGIELDLGLGVALCGGGAII